MPRPKDGYKNSADQPVPGVHDITGRYADKNALIGWAYNRGKAGLPRYGSELDIGTAVHRMAELDLRGANPREIERIPFEMLQAAEDIDMAHQAFRQFQDWRKTHDVRAVSLEESIVSERWQYGGTLDHVLRIDGLRGLFDTKTCKTAGQVYLEQRIALSAHGNLWREKHPDLPLDGGYHLIMLPKDGSKFGHHAFSDLSPEWEMFTLQLDCWRIEKGLTRKRTTKPATVMPAPKAALAALVASVEAMTAEASRPVIEATETVDPFRPANAPPLEPPPAAAKPKRTRKPKAAAPIAPVAAVTPAVVTPPLSSLSLAEILRANGFVPPLEEAIRC